MQLIDLSYFYGKLWIPPNDHPNGFEFFKSTREQYERRFLDMLLGENLKARLLNELIKPAPHEKFLEMKNLLVNEDEKSSPIANYIYWFYINRLLEKYSKYGGIQDLYTAEELREIKVNAANAWNEMANWVIDTRDWFIDFCLKNKYDSYFFIMYAYESYKEEFDPIDIYKLKL